MNLVQNVRRQGRQNIGKNSYIGRYSKVQISADNIGEPIYRSSLVETPLGLREFVHYLDIIRNYS